LSSACGKVEQDAMVCFGIAGGCTPEEKWCVSGILGLEFRRRGYIDVSPSHDSSPTIPEPNPISPKAPAWTPSIPHPLSSYHKEKSWKRNFLRSLNRHRQLVPNAPINQYTSSVLSSLEGIARKSDASTKDLFDAEAA
jgi:hypothetical protein